MRLAAELRKAILLQAIQGKLTFRMRSDEPVENQIERLASKHTVNSKKDQCKMDIPAFNIPESWAWTTLAKLGTLFGGKTPSMQDESNWSSSDINWFTSKDMKEKYLNDSKMKISIKGAGELQLFPAGTLLMVVRSGILKHTLPLSILCNEATINQDLKAFSLYDMRMSEFVYWMLKGLEPIIIQKYTKHVTTVDSLRLDDFFYRMPVPLPPIEEQQRIVDRLNELVPKIDEYEEMENRLVALKEAFPGNLRESILFSAIQGKLTQQYDSDEPVANLKKRLSDRKTAAGVISKKDKLPMSHPTFDIPESWTWTTLSKLGTLSGGKTPSMQDAENWASPDVNWFTSKDMKQKYLSESLMKISLKASEELQLFPSGTLLMVVRSGILKHTLPLCVLTQEATINQDLKAFTLFDNEMSEYVYWMLKGLQPEIITRYTKHVTTVDSLKMDEFFYQMPVPLPPIEEQRRIVERLNTILPLCDALAEDI